MRTASEVLAALAARYPAPQFAFLPQVADSTGSVGRTADAIAMSLWPSRGLELIGFEIKVNRADWLRELKQPEKAESILRFCDRWYIAIPHQGIVGPGELPPTWGLIETAGGRARVTTEAPKLEASPLSRRFLAAVLRRVDAVRPDRKMLAEAEKKARDHARDEVAAEAKRLRGAVEKFEAAAGVRLEDWRATEIGEAVRFALDGGLASVRRELERCHAIASLVVVQTEKALTGGGA